jgi:hypothetical protein
LSCVDINYLLAAKKKREAYFCLPKSPSFGSSKNVQGHVPLLFSLFLSCVVGLFCVVFLPVSISLSSFPCGFPFFQNQSEKRKKRQEKRVCVPAFPNRRRPENKPKIERRKKEKSSQRQVCPTETCPFREKAKNSRRSSEVSQARKYSRNATTMGRAEGDEVEPPYLPGSTMCVQRIR